MSSRQAPPNAYPSESDAVNVQRSRLEVPVPFPLLGEEGLEEALIAAGEAGLITQSEALEQYELHKLIREARAA